MGNGGNTKQIIMNLLIPSDNPNCPDVSISCPRGQVPFYTSKSDGCEQSTCSSTGGLPIFPHNSPPKPLGPALRWIVPTMHRVQVTEDENDKEKCDKVVKADRCGWGVYVRKCVKTCAKHNGGKKAWMNEQRDCGSVVPDDGKRSPPFDLNDPVKGGPAVTPFRPPAVTPSKPVSPTIPSPGVQPQPVKPVRPTPSQPSSGTGTDIWPSSRCEARKSAGRCGQSKVAKMCAGTCGGGSSGSSTNVAPSVNRPAPSRPAAPSSGKTDKKEKKDKSKKKKKKKKRKSELEAAIGSYEKKIAQHDQTNFNFYLVFGFRVLIGSIASFICHKPKTAERHPLLQTEVML